MTLGRLFSLAFLLLAASGVAMTETPAAPKYGSNAAAGGYVEHGGVRFYYETYGSGPPLLLIHGNGANIRSLSGQIDYFRKSRRVIVMDSRDHGRSGDSPVPLTFEMLSDDLAHLLDDLRTGPVDVLGWSDGGIEALLLGLRHPEKVTRIAAMAANLDPAGVYPAFLDPPEAPLPPGKVLDPKAARERRVKALDRDEPHIKPEALEAIVAPTLVMASDHDAIRDEHTLEIYHHLRNSQLVIFPNATHMIPIDDPATFNAAADRFFSTPFVKKDRLGDLLKTLQRLMAEAAAEK